jgi:hypothetical protein
VLYPGNLGLYLPLALKVGGSGHEGGGLVNNNLADRQVLLDVAADIAALDLLSGNAIFFVVIRVG